MKNSTKRKMQI